MSNENSVDASFFVVSVCGNGIADAPSDKKLVDGCETGDDYCPKCSTPEQPVQHARVRELRTAVVPWADNIDEFVANFEGACRDIQIEELTAQVAAYEAAAKALNS
jgi:hypothetical protein